MSVNSKMTAIADKIRSHTLSEEKLSLDTMPGEIEMACMVEHEAGYQEGYADAEAESGYDKGVEDGKQAEYDRFWDAFQDYGNRRTYTYAFSYGAWTDETYNPKYDIVCNGDISSLFQYSYVTDTKVTIDISAATSTSAAFRRNTYLKTIRKLIVSETTPINTNTFQGATGLENIVFGGTIGCDLVLGESTKLSRASIENIVEHLSDTATGKTLTLSKTAVEAAFGSTTAAEWTALAGTKPNWTISLV